MILTAFLLKIFEEEIAPKLKKLREEREQFLEYQQLDRELEIMLALHQCWQFCQAKLLVKNSQQNLESARSKIAALEQNIKENIDAANNLDKQIEEMTSSAQSVRKLLFC